MPTKSTLNKYGLSLEEWQTLYDKYRGACHICKKVPSTGRLNVDHFHVPKWKQLPPEQKKLYVRGLLCYTCNFKLLQKGITVEKLQHAIEYLQEWENKKPS